MVLGRRFYQKDTLEVAQNLLGCFLIRQVGKKKIKGRITETEAYIGEDDLASHASKGRTPRTEIMYGKAGRAYIYMIYGMYHCLNIVTEKKNFPAAVLIRGVADVNIKRAKINSKNNPLFNSPPFKGGEDLVLKGYSPPFKGGEDIVLNGYFPPLKGEEDLVLNGPGKLCRFFKIDRKLNGWDLTHAPKQGLVQGFASEEGLWIEKGIKINSKDIKKSKRVGVDYAGKCKNYLWRFSLE